MAIPNGLVAAWPWRRGQHGREAGAGESENPAGLHLQDTVIEIGEPGGRVGKRRRQIVLVDRNRGERRHRLRVELLRRMIDRLAARRRVVERDRPRS